MKLGEQEDPTMIVFTMKFKEQQKKNQPKKLGLFNLSVPCTLEPIRTQFLVPSTRDKAK